MLGHWDEINWKLTDIPDDCDLDFDEMTRDEIKGISPRKNKNQYYKNYCNGKYFKKKDE